MNPGRELDKLVAEKVFGHEVVKQKGPVGRDDYMYKSGNGFIVVPQYSTHISAAWAVLEAVRGHCMARSVYFHQSSTGYLIGLGQDSANGIDFTEIEGFGETTPHAICLLAIKAYSSIP